MIFNYIKVLFVTGGNLSELYKNYDSPKKKISFYIQEQAENNFSKIRSSRIIHILTWDCENYILRQNAKNHEVICDIAYLVKKDYDLK